MRILLTVLAPSHLLCMVPLAWCARAAGHEVLVAGRTEVAAAAQQAGLPATEVAELPAASAGAHLGTSGPDPQVPGAPRMAALLSDGQRREFAGRQWNADGHPWQVRVARVVDGYLAAARYWRPDVLLCDPLEFAGLVTGAVLDVPVVVHRWGGPDSLSAEAISRAQTILAGLAGRLGSHGVVPEPAATIDPCPPSLRLDRVTPIRPMRYLPYNGALPVPGWVRSARRRILVTFGLFGSQAATTGADFVAGGDLVARVRTVLTALRPWSSYDVVLTVPEQVAAELGATPQWLRVVTRVPLDQLLDQCDLLVHHGGTGTAMNGCARGVPQLLLPPEHPALLDCAQGLQQRGIGLVLTGAAQTDPEALRAAVGELVDEARHRDQAQAVREEIETQPLPSTVISWLTRLRL